MEPVTGVFEWPGGSNRWFARCPDCGQDLGYRGTDHAKAEAHLADHRLRKHGADRLRELRRIAAGDDPATGGCLELKFDPSYPEAVLLWKGHPIVMVRSLSFGSEDGEELDDRYFPAEGRFAIYSWDNEGTEGEWTGNMHPEGEFTGKPPSLWESSLTWPPRKDKGERRPDPRKNADDAYDAFMSMSDSEWLGLIGSLAGGGVLEVEEQKGFERAATERALRRGRQERAERQKADFFCGDCNEYHPPGLHTEDDNADKG